MIDPAALPAPPVADVRPHRYERHGRTVEDAYHWLKDAGYPNVTNADVLAYLRAENGYFDAAMAPLRPLVDTLFEEMKGRIQTDDASVPRRDGAWESWWAFEAGAQYRRWLRRPADGAGPTQVIVDEVAEAAGHDYFRMGALAVSPDGRLAAWTCDTSGAERFTLRIRDLASGADVETVSAVVNGAVVWSAQSDAVAYTEVNDNWRTYRARLHRLGGDPVDDVTLYEEADQGFNVGLGRTQDRRWIVMRAGDHETSETRLLPADDPGAAPLLVSPRVAKRQYEVDSAHDRLWILTNDRHVNFRIASADPAAPGDWTGVIEGSDRVYLRGLTAFARHLAIEERVDGLDQVRLRGYDGGEHRVSAPIPSSTRPTIASATPRWSRPTRCSTMTPMPGRWRRAKCTRCHRATTRAFMRPSG